MKTIHSMIPLAAIVAGAAACSGSTDGAPDLPTSGLLNAQSAFAKPVPPPSGAIVPQLVQSSPTMEATVPGNGDVNPYGVAFVPQGFPAGGPLSPGDIIVANFNNSMNLQGTGTTIVRANAPQPPFFQNSAIVGLSTALGVLKKGFVIVGNVPSTDGTGVCVGNQSNVGQGQLTVLDRQGIIVQPPLADPSFVNGPWDLTIDDHGDTASVYVSNMLSGTVSRIDLNVGDSTVTVASKTLIAFGYAHRCDSAAFVVGPTGLALDPGNKILYVASTADNNIFAVNLASAPQGMGVPIVNAPSKKHLHGPLGLVRAANGDLIAAQGDAVNPKKSEPSEIVEFTPNGEFVAQISVDPGLGGAFGIALEQLIPGDPDDFRFAAVNDNVPNLDVWDVQ
jgi:hypothetical protein